MEGAASQRARWSVARAGSLGLAIALLLTIPGVALGARTSAGPMEWSLSGSRILVLPVGPGGSADSARAFQPSVVQATNGTYLMYYTGSNGFINQVLWAWSPDGLSWTKIAGSLLLNNGAGSPFVMLAAGGYRMWFESVVWGQGPLGYTDRIYGATSPDGLRWTVTGVVLDVGAGSAWDAATVADPWVAQGTDGVYRMYYSMYATNGSVAVGLATSTDLRTFTKWAGNPILVPGPVGNWDDASVSNPSVVPGATWTLFFQGLRAGQTGQVGVATSSDGEHWVPDANPFLGYGAPGTWDSAGIGAPDYAPMGSGRLYYDGGNAQGLNQIGMVNLSGGEVGGWPGGGSISGAGLTWVDVAALIAIVGLGIAVVGVAAVVLQRPPRGRQP